MLYNLQSLVDISDWNLLWKCV